MANINNINLATLSFDEIRKLLSPEEIERVYRLQQLDYRIQDVEAHAEDMLNKGDITEEELWNYQKPEEVSSEDIALLKAVKSLASRQEAAQDIKNPSQPAAIPPKTKERV